MKTDSLFSRFRVAAVWDLRWVVIATQIKADSLAIETAALAAIVGLVMLPWCIARAVLRWPCKPIYWLWFAWSKPGAFARLREITGRLP